MGRCFCLVGYNRAMYQNSAGVLQKDGNIDYLYRVALRALIRNDKGEILIVKEQGRDWWDLPGGGLNYGESAKDGLARELREEIGFSGDFECGVLALQTPEWNERLGVMQMNVLFEVKLEDMDLNLGVDGCELTFQLQERIYETNPPDSRICIQLKALKDHV